MKKYILPCLMLLSCAAAPLAKVDTSVDNKPLKQMSIARLNKGEHFRCTIAVIGKNYALTAAHCLIDEEGNLLGGLTVTSNDQTVKVKVKAEKVDNRRDIGLISGNFSDFDYFPVANNSIGIGEKNASCGYAGGNKAFICSLVTPVVNDLFLVVAKGFLVGGMSGGPVINLDTNELIGINTQVYSKQSGGGIGYSPVLGILGRFEIEP